jgi:hypothetical protein
MLHAASRKPIRVPELVESLGERGYKMSSHSGLTKLRTFERKGWIRPRDSAEGSSLVFRTTLTGRKILREAKPFVKALFRKISASPYINRLQTNELNPTSVTFRVRYRRNRSRNVMAAMNR